jgi:Transposase DDE domain
LRGRWKRGAERNALGRSRGGFSTKINARTNTEGLPIGVVITPGQAHDVTAFPALMQEIDCDPEHMLGDKGYDSEAVRREIEQRGGEAAIPSTATRKIQHAVDRPFMPCEIESSASSIERRTHAASPPAMTS